jgi:peroxiredoxin
VIAGRSTGCLALAAALGLAVSHSAPAGTDAWRQQLESAGIEAPKERLPAPGFELQSLDGRSVRLEDYRGRLVLLNFWATFCKPCRDELPAMTALLRQFGDRGLVVLAVAVDRGNRRGIQAFFDQQPVDFPVPLDPEGSVRKRYEIDALPTSYLIGRDGYFIGRAIGEKRWDSPDVTQLIEHLLSWR